MAKSIFGLRLSNQTGDIFRAWGSALSAQIGSMLTRVPQTGDINWNTVALPTTGTYAAGGEIYRFNDSLQSTKPIFILFEYGAAANDGILMRVTIGKSTDGVGRIVDQLFAPTVVFGFGSAATGVESCYVSAGSTWFALSLAPVSTARGGYLAIERSTDGSGNALHVAVQNAANATQTHRFIDYASAASETVSTGIVAIPLDLSTDRSIANGTVAPIFPAACISPAGVYWRPRVILGTARQNAGLGEVITGLLDGNSYLSLGAGSQVSDQRSSPFAATLIRWD